MSKTITTARIRADGKVVKISKGGKQRPFPEKPLRPMTEAQVKAAAYADPDALPITGNELRRAKRIPRVKTLRRALDSLRRSSRPAIRSRSAHFGIGSREGLSLTNPPG